MRDTRSLTGALYSMEDVLEETKAEGKLVRELEEYGVIKGELRGGVRYFDETEREIIGAVAELARYGVGGRNLRVFRSSADREASLLQQILAPALRSRNPAAAQGGGRSAGEPGGRRDPPEAPAAGARPAQDRPLSRWTQRASEPQLRELIREIPDFPSRGHRLQGHHAAAGRSAARCRRRSRVGAVARPLKVDCVIAAEARGFLLGPALALELGAGFVLARKPASSV